MSEIHMCNTKCVQPGQGNKVIEVLQKGFIPDGLPPRNTHCSTPQGVKLISKLDFRVQYCSKVG